MRLASSLLLISAFALEACVTSHPCSLPDCVIPTGSSDPMPLDTRVTFILPTGEHIAGSCTPYWLVYAGSINYPEGARKARMQGIVVVRGVLSEQGEVQEVHVIRGLNPLLDNAVLRGVRQWVFAATGHPTFSREFESTIRFALR